MSSPQMKAPPLNERQRPSFEDSSRAFPERPWEEIDPIEYAGASIASFAEERVVDPEVLMQFNFGTRDPEEVNWWLGQLGCTEVTESGNNYTFAGWSGIFWVPLAQSFETDEPLFEGAMTEGPSAQKSITLPIKIQRPANGESPPFEYGWIAARFELQGSLKLTLPANQVPEITGGVTKLSVQAEVSQKLFEDIEGGLSTKWEAIDLVDAMKDMAELYVSALAPIVRPSEARATKSKLKETLVSTFIPEIEATVKSQFDNVFGTDADVEFQAGFNINIKELRTSFKKRRMSLNELRTPFSVQVTVKGGDDVLAPLKSYLPAALTSLSGLQATLSVAFTIKVGPSNKIVLDLGKRLGGMATTATALELGAAVATVGVVYSLVGFMAWADRTEEINDDAVFANYKSSYIYTVMSVLGHSKEATGKYEHAINAGRDDARADALRFFGDTEDPLSTYRAWVCTVHDRYGAKQMLNYILDKRREQVLTGEITPEGPGAEQYREFLHKARNGWLPANLFDNPELADRAMADNIRERLLKPDAPTPSPIP